MNIGFTSYFVEYLTNSATKSSRARKRKRASNIWGEEKEGKREGYGGRYCYQMIYKDCIVLVAFSHASDRGEREMLVSYV